MKFDPSGNGPLYTTFLGLKINGVAVDKRPPIIVPTYATIILPAFGSPVGRRRPTRMPLSSSWMRRPSSSCIHKLNSLLRGAISKR